MQEIYDFLNKAGTFYLATCENGQPRVRPFGAVHLQQERLYILTGKRKGVSRQLHANPKLALCAMLEGRWLRLEASVVEDDGREARAAMLAAYPKLKALYAPDGEGAELWYLRKATATFYSRSEPPRIVKF